MKGSRKHQKREEKAKIQKRHYHVIHNGNTDTDSNVKLPIQNTKYVAKGFPSKKNEKYNGLMAHYHFYADPNLDMGQIAACRIPCLCRACLDQLSLPWSKDVPESKPIQQPKFKTPEQCELQNIFGDTNNWKIINLVEGKVVDKEEVKELYEMILDEHEAEITDAIIVDDFAAVEYDADDAYYIVCWTDTPKPVEEYDSNDALADVEGCSRDMLPDGTAVCKGVYWSQPGCARCWYVPPDDPEKQYLFRV